MLGAGAVTSEEEFRAKIAENMKNSFVADSDYKFLQDLRAYLVNRIGAVEYPEELLKRIMKQNNAEKDDAYLEEQFQSSLDELTWHLIKEQLSDQFELKVEQPDVLETAKVATRMQFAQYGMSNLPDDVITNYATEMLKNQKQAESLVARAGENKIVAKAKETVKLT